MNFMEDNKISVLKWDERWENTLGSKMSLKSFE